MNITFPGFAALTAMCAWVTAKPALQAWIHARRPKAAHDSPPAPLPPAIGLAPAASTNPEAERISPMSILSSAENTVTNDVKAVASFFEGMAAKVAAANVNTPIASTVSTTATQLTSAASAAQAAIPAVVTEVVNYALTFIPDGVAFEALADQVLDQIIAALTAKKSAA